MDSPLGFDNMKSLSQPVTPKRTTSLSSSGTSPDHSYSLPNSALRRTPIFNIHLPVQELFQQEINKLRSHQLHNERGRSRTKPSTPTNRASLTPRRTKSLTPNIRSESLTPRSRSRSRSGTRTRTSLIPIHSRPSSRRRSSIIVTNDGEKLYKPDYQGPITLDYLRFFCKASIQSEEKIKTKKQELNNPFIDIKTSTPDIYVEMDLEQDDTIEDVQVDPAITNETDVIENFNDSLQIPEDYEQLLVSDTEANTSVKDEKPETSYESPPAEGTVEKPKPLSFLQKILLTKKRQSSFLGNFETEEKQNSVILKEEIQVIEKVEGQIELGDTVATGERHIDQFTIHSNSQIDNEVFPAWTKDEKKIESGNDKSEVGLSDEALKTAAMNRAEELKVEDFKQEEQVSENNFVPIDEQRQETDELPVSKHQDQEVDWHIPELGSDIREGEDMQYQLQEPGENQELGLIDDDSTHSTIPKQEFSNEAGATDITPEDSVLDGDDNAEQTPDILTPFHSHSLDDQPASEESSSSGELFVGEEIGQDNDEIIQEEFVLEEEDGVNESIFDGIIEGQKSNTDGEHIEERTDGQTSQLTSLERMIPQKRKILDPPSGLDVNFRDVSYIVKSIQAQNFLEAEMPPRKKSKKPKAFSKDLVLSIQDKSNGFLDNLMDDLKSYAQHRGSDTVDMKDVLLYLQRVRFADSHDSSSEEIDRISVLAQRFLPLEDLISLDNDLYNSVSLNK